MLADFEGGARRVLGMSVAEFERRCGRGGFWARLAATPGFFETLQVLSDAGRLFEAVRPLSPIILTGVPPGTWAQPQKRRWAARHFPGTPVITTKAALKREHCHPGDVLIDDWASRRKTWEGAGGRFVHHRCALGSIAALRALGFRLAA